MRGYAADKGELPPLNNFLRIFRQRIIFFEAQWQNTYPPPEQLSKIRNDNREVGSWWGIIVCCLYLGGSFFLLRELLLRAERGRNRSVLAPLPAFLYAVYELEDRSALFMLIINLKIPSALSGLWSGQTAKPNSVLKAADLWFMIWYLWYFFHSENLSYIITKTLFRFASVYRHKRSTSFPQWHH